MCDSGLLSQHQHWYHSRYLLQNVDCPALSCMHIERISIVTALQLFGSENHPGTWGHFHRLIGTLNSQVCESPLSTCSACLLQFCVSCHAAAPRPVPYSSECPHGTRATAEEEAYQAHYYHVWSDGSPRIRRGVLVSQGLSLKTVPKEES